MLASLLLVVVLLSCVICVPIDGSSDSTPTEEKQELSTSSLEYVYVFFRHGIRAPLYKPYANDPNKKDFDKHFSKLGQLTKAGITEMYDVGKRLLNIYGGFLGGYSDEKVRVTSTEMSRTITSALCTLAGLFPAKEPLLPDLPKWEPIPVFQNTREFDKAYLYNDPKFPKMALEQCPKFGTMVDEGHRIVTSKDEDQSHKAIYEMLQKETGKQNVNSIDTAYEIFDILEMEALNGLSLPSWATKRRAEFDNKPLYPDVMRQLQVNWFYTCHWLRKNNDMLYFYTGPLFHSIVGKFNQKIKSNDINKEKFWYHSTHDDTLLTLRWALDFDDCKFEVEAGDGIAFELHQQEGKHYVQVVYYHSLREPKEFREVLQLPKCPSPCLLEDFSNHYQSLSPEEWAKKCEGP